MPLLNDKKRIIAIVLVIANVLSSTGFNTFAFSIPEIIYQKRTKESETKNYYYEYVEETFTFEELTETINVLGSENPDNKNDDNNLTKVSINNNETSESAKNAVENGENEKTVQSSLKKAEDEQNKANVDVDDDTESGYEDTPEVIVEEEIGEDDLEVYDDYDELEEEETTYEEEEEDDEEIVEGEMSEEETDFSEEESEEGTIESETEMSEEETLESETEMSEKETTETVEMTETTVAEEQTSEETTTEIIPEESTTLESVEESIVDSEEATESEIVDIEETTVEESEATESEIKETIDEEIASESEIEIIDTEKATDSEIDQENVKATVSDAVKVSTDSEIDLVVASVSEATMSEIDIATDSEIEVATMSDISLATGSEATMSELTEKNVATRSDIATGSDLIWLTGIATISKAKWSLKKILLPQNQEGFAREGESEAYIKKHRIATMVEVIVVDRKGDEMKLRVPAKWNVRDRIENDVLADQSQPVLTQEEFKKDIFFDDITTNVEVKISTSNDTKVVESLKEKYGENIDIRIFDAASLAEIKKQMEKAKIERDEEILDKDLIENESEKTSEEETTAAEEETSEEETEEEMISGEEPTYEETEESSEEETSEEEQFEEEQLEEETSEEEQFEEEQLEEEQLEEETSEEEKTEEEDDDEGVISFAGSKESDDDEEYDDDEDYDDDEYDSDEDIETASQSSIDTYEAPIKVDDMTVNDSIVDSFDYINQDIFYENKYMTIYELDPDALAESIIEELIKKEATVKEEMQRQELIASIANAKDTKKDKEEVEEIEEDIPIFSFKTLFSFLGSANKQNDTKDADKVKESTESNIEDNEKENEVIQENSQIAEIEGLNPMPILTLTSTGPVSPFGSQHNAGGNIPHCICGSDCQKIYHKYFNEDDNLFYDKNERKHLQSDVKYIPLPQSKTIPTNNYDADYFFKKGEGGVDGNGNKDVYCYYMTQAIDFKVRWYIEEGVTVIICLNGCDLFFHNEYTKVVGEEGLRLGTTECGVIKGPGRLIISNCTTGVNNKASFITRRGDDMAYETPIQMAKFEMYGNTTNTGNANIIVKDIKINAHKRDIATSPEIYTAGTIDGTNGSAFFGTYNWDTILKDGAVDKTEKSNFISKRNIKHGSKVILSGVDFENLVSTRGNASIQVSAPNSYYDEMIPLTGNTETEQRNKETEFLDNIYGKKTKKEIGCDVYVESCSFDRCISGGLGGAISVNNGQMHLYNNTFKNCSSELDGGAVHFGNGRNGDSEILSCTFEGNKALFNGAAVSMKNAIGLRIDKDETGSIYDDRTLYEESGETTNPYQPSKYKTYKTRFIENVAEGSGGGLAYYESNYIDQYIYQNGISGVGTKDAIVGRIVTHEPSIYIGNAEFIANKANVSGGAIHISDNAGPDTKGKDITLKALTDEAKKHNAAWWRNATIYDKDYQKVNFNNIKYDENRKLKIEITTSSFIGNSATNLSAFGGAMHITGNIDLVLGGKKGTDGVYLASNKAQAGAGLFAQGYEPWVYYADMGETPVYTYKNKKYIKDPYRIDVTINVSDTTSMDELIAAKDLIEINASTMKGSFVSVHDENSTINYSKKDNNTCILKNELRMNKNKPRYASISLLHVDFVDGDSYLQIGDFDTAAVAIVNKNKKEIADQQQRENVDYKTLSTRYFDMTKEIKRKANRTRASYSDIIDNEVQYGATGGAMYLGRNVTVEVTNTGFKENQTGAIMLDGANVVINDTEFKENVSKFGSIMEYARVATSNIMFNNSKIIDNVVGNIRDIYEPHRLLCKTELVLSGECEVLRNFRGGIYTDERNIRVDLDTINIKWDRGFEPNRKVGIYSYEIDEALVTDQWNKANPAIPKYGVGVTPQDYFHVDGTELNEGKFIYRDNEKVYFGKNGIKVHFDVEVNGRKYNVFEELFPDQYIKNDTKGTIIDQPTDIMDPEKTQIIENDEILPYTLCGFVGHDYNTKNTGNKITIDDKGNVIENINKEQYSTWDFNTSVLVGSASNLPYDRVLKVVYTDDTIHEKVCGAPNTNIRNIEEYVMATVSESTAANARSVWSDEEEKFVYQMVGYHVTVVATSQEAMCDHVGFDGMMHADRGYAPTGTLLARYINYVAVSDIRDLYFAHRINGKNYVTQYVLNNDIYFDDDCSILKGKNIHLNGYNIYIRTSKNLMELDGEEESLFATEVDFIDGIKEAHPMVVGLVGDSENKSSIIYDRTVYTGTYSALIKQKSKKDVKSNHVILKNLKIKDVTFDEGVSLIDCDYNNNQYKDNQSVTLENVEISDIDVAANLINSKALYMKGTNIHHITNTRKTGCDLIHTSSFGTGIVDSTISDCTYDGGIILNIDDKENADKLHYQNDILLGNTKITNNKSAKILKVNDALNTSLDRNVVIKKKFSITHNTTTAGENLVDFNILSDGHFVVDEDSEFDMSYNTLDYSLSTKVPFVNFVNVAYKNTVDIKYIEIKGDLTITHNTITCPDNKDTNINVGAWNVPFKGINIPNRAVIKVYNSRLNIHSFTHKNGEEMDYESGKSRYKYSIIPLLVEKRVDKNGDMIPYIQIDDSGVFKALDSKVEVWARKTSDELRILKGWYSGNVDGWGSPDLLIDKIFKRMKDIRYSNTSADFDEDNRRIYKQELGKDCYVIYGKNYSTLIFVKYNEVNDTYLKLFTEDDEERMNYLKEAYDDYETDGGNGISIDAADAVGKHNYNYVKLQRIAKSALTTIEPANEYDPVTGEVIRYYWKHPHTEVYGNGSVDHEFEQGVKMTSRYQVWDIDMTDASIITAAPEVYIYGRKADTHTHSVWQGDKKYRYIATIYNAIPNIGTHSVANWDALPAEYKYNYWTEGNDYKTCYYYGPATIYEARRIDEIRTATYTDVNFWISAYDEDENNRYTNMRNIVGPAPMPEKRTKTIEYFTAGSGSSKKSEPEKQIMSSFDAPNGSIVLREDVTIRTPMIESPLEDYNICLNGHTLTIALTPFEEETFTFNRGILGMEDKMVRETINPTEWIKANKENLEMHITDCKGGGKIKIVDDATYEEYVQQGGWSTKIYQGANGKDRLQFTNGASLYLSTMSIAHSKTSETVQINGENKTVNSTNDMKIADIKGGNFGLKNITFTGNIKPSQEAMFTVSNDAKVLTGTADNGPFVNIIDTKFEDNEDITMDKPYIQVSNARTINMDNVSITNIFGKTINNATDHNILSLGVIKDEDTASININNSKLDTNRFITMEFTDSPINIKNTTFVNNESNMYFININKGKLNIENSEFINNVSDTIIKASQLDEIKADGFVIKNTIQSTKTFKRTQTFMDISDCGDLGTTSEIVNFNITNNKYDKSIINIKNSRGLRFVNGTIDKNETVIKDQGTIVNFEGANSDIAFVGQTRYKEVENRISATQTEIVKVVDEESSPHVYIHNNIVKGDDYGVFNNERNINNNNIVYIEGDIHILDNYQDTGKTKPNNVRTIEGISFGFDYKDKEIEHTKITDTSVIKVTPGDNNVKLYTGWNEYSIGGFDKPVSPDCSYNPEKIFVLDNANKTYQGGTGNKALVYKKGAYPDVEVWFGDNYEKLYHLAEQDYRTKNVNNAYNVQYLAHDDTAAADKVFLKNRLDIADIFQVWQGPKYLDPTSTIKWNVMNENTPCKISTTSYVILTTHMHRVNGTEVFFRGVSSIEDLYRSSISEVVFVGSSLIDQKIDFGKFNDRTLHICLDGASLGYNEGQNIFDVASNSRLTIEDCHYHGRGTIKIMDIATKSTASLLVVHDDGEVNIKGINIASMNTTKEIPMFEAKEGSIINISDVIIKDNVFVNPIIHSHGKQAKITFDETSKIENNTTSKDTVIYAYDKGTVEVKNGATILISGNTIDKGGAIKLDDNATFEVNGTVTLSDNKVDKGGYVYMDNTSNLYADDAIVDVKNGKARLGGGIYLVYKSTDNVIKPSLQYNISDNNAEYGGGLYIDISNNVKGMIDIAGGNVNIHDNTASYGGGVVIGSTSNTTDNILNIGDIKITNNTADIAGGGLYYDSVEDKGCKTINIKETVFTGNKCDVDGIFMYLTGKAKEGHINIKDIKAKDATNEGSSFFYINTTADLEGMKITNINQNWVNINGQQKKVSRGTLIKVVGNDNKVSIKDLILEKGSNKANRVHNGIKVEKDDDKTLILSVSNYQTSEGVYNAINVENVHYDATSSLTFDDVTMEENTGTIYTKDKDSAEFESDDVAAERIYYAYKSSISTIFNDMTMNGLTDKKIARVVDSENITFNDTKILNNTIQTNALTIEDSKVDFIGNTEIKNNITSGTKKSMIRIMGTRTRVTIKDKLSVISNTSNATDEHSAAAMTIEGESIVYIQDNVANITANSSEKGVIAMFDKARLYLEGKTYIYGNRDYKHNNKTKNIVINSTLSYIYYDAKNTNKLIASDSKIGITDNAMDSTVFKYWTKDSIASYNAPTYFAPEEIFKVDTKHIENDEVIYKKGTRSNVELAIGSEYEKLIYKYREGAIIATQYVARGIDTLVDLVTIKDIEKDKQVWIGPDQYDELHDIKWEPGIQNIVNITDTRYVTLEIHEHFICGCEAVDEATMCEIHGISKKVWYAPLSGDNDLHNIKFENYVLTEDVVLSQPMTNRIATINICLNGHTLAFEDGVQFINPTSTSKHITICDCKEDGRISNVFTTHDTNPTIIFSIGSGMDMSIYNADIAGFTNIANESKKLINVNGGSLKLIDTHIHDNNIKGKVPIILAENADIKVKGLCIYDNDNTSTASYTTALLQIKNTDRVSIEEVIATANETVKGIVEMTNVRATLSDIKLSHNIIKENGILLPIKNDIWDVEGDINIEENESQNTLVKVIGPIDTRMHNGAKITYKSNDTYKAPLYIDKVDTDLMGREFISNEGCLSGAIYVVNASISNAYIKDSNTKYAGGIYVASDSEYTNIKDFTFEGNKAMASAIYSVGNVIIQNNDYKVSKDDTIIYLDGEDTHTTLDNIKINDMTYGTIVYIATLSTISTVDIVRPVISTTSGVNAIVLKGTIASVSVIDAYIAHNTFDESLVKVDNGTICFVGTTSICENKALTSSIMKAITNGYIEVDGDFEVKDNVTKKGAIALYDNAKMVLRDKVVVKDNKAVSTNDKAINVYLDNDNARMIYKDGKKISTDSIIYITANTVEGKIFTYWNKDSFSAYNTDPHYLPQQVFGLDEKYDGTTDRVYKKGTGSQVSVHVGSDYYTLIFTNRMKDIIVATQYIAKNTYTTTDRVVIPEIDYTVQNWMGPIPDNDEEEERWECGRTVDIKMTADREVYMTQHIHEDGTAYMSVYTAKDFNHSYQNHFVLQNDVSLTQPLKITDGLSICLNGYTLYYNGDRTVLDIKNGEKVKICDCLTNENQNFIRGTLAKATVSIATINFAMALVERGSVEFENVIANGAASFSEVDGEMQVDYQEMMKFVKVLGTSSLALKNIEIKGFYTDDSIIYFNSSSRATISDITFKYNRSDSTGGLIQFLDGDVLMYGTASLCYNEAIKDYSEGVLHVEGANVIIGATVSRTKKVIDGDGKEQEVKEDYMSGYIVAENNTAGSGGFLYVKGTDSKVNVLSSFVVRNNKVTGNGGGIYLNDHANLNVKGEILIEENKAYEAKDRDGRSIEGNGGGIYIAQYSTFTHDGTIMLRKNEAAASGGGLFIENAHMDLEGYLFDGNFAHTGGSMYLENGDSITLKGMTIDGSRALYQGGALGFKNIKTVNIEDCVFRNNESGGWVRLGTEGVIRNKPAHIKYQDIDKDGENDEYYFYGNGGVMYLGGIQEDNIVTIKDTLFENNHSADAGAVSVDNVYGKFIIDGCTFKSNTAEDNAGAIAFVNIFNNDVKIQNTYFNGNSSTLSGGAVGIYGYVDDIMKISNYAGVVFDQCTFNANHTEQSGAAISANRLKKLTIIGDGVNPTFENNFCDVSEQDIEEGLTAGGAAGGAIYFNEVAYDQKEEGDGLYIKDVIFEHNHASYLGGALFIRSSMSGAIALDVSDTEFAENYAGGNYKNEKYGISTPYSATSQGGAIYILGTVYATISDVMFDTNLAETGGAISVDNSKVVYTEDKELIIVPNAVKSKINIDNVEIKGARRNAELNINVIDAGAIYLYCAEVDVKDVHITDCINPIYLLRSKINMKDILLDQNIGNYALGFSSTDIATISMIDSKIINNHMTQFSEVFEENIFASDSDIRNTVILGGHIEIRDNTVQTSIQGKPVQRNLFVHNDSLMDVYANPDKKITNDSIIYLSAPEERDDTRVFSKYNGLHIEGYDEMIYKKVFHLDNEAEELKKGRALYLKGLATESNGVELWIGKNFSTLTFRDEREERIVIASQNVAKGVRTTVDKVFVDDLPKDEQNWYGPYVEKEKKFVKWNMYKSKQIANITKDRIVKIVKDHYHENTYYPYLDGITKFGDIVDEKKSNNNIYYALLDDYEIDYDYIEQQAKIGDELVICLNGYALTYEEGLQLIKLAEGKTLTICDCCNLHEKGSIGTIDSQNNYTKPFIEAAGGTLNLQNVTLTDIDLTNKGKSLIKASNGAKVNLDDVDIDGVKVGTDSLISLDNVELSISKDMTIANAEAKNAILDIRNINTVKFNALNIIKTTTSQAAIHTENTQIIINGELNAKDNVGYYGTAFNSKNTIIRDNKTSIVENNKAYNGGVFYLDNSKIDFIDKLRAKNNKATKGGVFYLTNVGKNDGEMIIRNADIEKNEADHGGAIYLIDSNVKLDYNVMIKANKNAIFNDRSTLSVAYNNKKHEELTASQEVIMTENIGDYVLSGSFYRGATYKLLGGKYIDNKAKALYEVSTSSYTTGKKDKTISMYFGGNVYIKSSDDKLYKSIYITDDTKELFYADKTYKMSDISYVSYYVDESGTKALENVSDIEGYGKGLDIKTILITEQPYRDKLNPTYPWHAYEIDGKVYIGLFINYPIIYLDEDGGYLDLKYLTNKDLPTYVQAGKIATIHNAAKDKRIFNGWEGPNTATPYKATKSNSLGIAIGDYVYDNSVIVYTNYATATYIAHWVTGTYTIRLDPNGGTGNPVSFTKKENEVFTFPTPFTKKNYWTSSYNTRPDGSGTSYSIFDTYKNIIPPKGEITLYAIWTKVAGGGGGGGGGGGMSGKNITGSTDMSTGLTTGWDGTGGFYVSVVRWEYDKNREKWRAFDDRTGIECKGWCRITYEGSTDWYYFEPQGGMYTGWLDDRGLKYYLTEKGPMAIGSRLIDNYVYVFDENGVLQTYKMADNAHASEGTWIQGVDGSWYYRISGIINGIDYIGINTNNKLEYATGLTGIAGKWYMFDDTGKMMTGLIEYQGETYFFDTTEGFNLGALTTGFIEIDDKLYFFDPTTGGTLICQVTEVPMDQVYRPQKNITYPTTKKDTTINKHITTDTFADEPTQDEALQQESSNVISKTGPTHKETKEPNLAEQPKIIGSETDNIKNDSDLISKLNNETKEKKEQDAKEKEKQLRITALIGDSTLGLSGIGQGDIGIISGNWVTTAAGKKQFLINKLTGKDTTKLLTGWCAIQTENGSKGWYHFQDDGTLVTGMLYDDMGNTYYAIPSGTNEGMIVTGWYEIDGYEYYFSETDGEIPYGAMIKNSTTPDGRSVDENGRLQTGR